MKKNSGSSTFFALLNFVTYLCLYNRLHEEEKCPETLGLPLFFFFSPRLCYFMLHMILYIYPSVLSGDFFLFLF